MKKYLLSFLLLLFPLLLFSGEPIISITKFGAIPGEGIDNSHAVQSAIDQGSREGDLDEIIIFNRALSEQEIKTLYEQSAQKQ
jgi:hypothetical protein